MRTFSVELPSDVGGDLTILVRGGDVPRELDGVPEEGGEVDEPRSWPELLDALRGQLQASELVIEAIDEYGDVHRLSRLALPFVVLGGIYSGYFAVSEAAAVTALYVLVVELLVLREVPWRRLPGIIRESMVLVGALARPRLFNGLVGTVAERALRHGVRCDVAGLAAKHDADCHQRSAPGDRRN